MIDDELSELPKSALRDYEGDPRLERVWQRLDAGLSTTPARTRSGVWLLPALGVALFAGGILVGRHSAPLREAAPPVAAELPQPSEAAHGPAPVPAAAEQPPAPRLTDRRRPLAARGRSSSSLRATAETEAFVAEAPPYAAPPYQPPDWQQKADAGDFAGARVALERAGGWDVALAGSSPEQLMTLVDLGRASSEREQAVRALRRLLDAFPGAPEAPLAAWTLANQLEQGGDHGGAAEAYALYRRLSPTGDFAEDAAARQLDAAFAQGDAERATELIDQYAKDFPTGRRLAEFREELEKLNAEASKATAAPESDSKTEALPAPSQQPQDAPPSQ
jgi:hypothetical protein